MMNLEDWREICRDAARERLTVEPIWRDACRMRGRGGSASAVRELLGLDGVNEIDLIADDMIAAQRASVSVSRDLVADPTLADILAGR